MEINSLGVIGAGAMGAGIAHVGALAGLDILLLDAERARTEAGVLVIRANMERQVRRETIGAGDMEAALARISVAEDYAGLSDCDCIIEAATENEAIKKEIFARLTETLKPEAIICTNTFVDPHHPARRDHRPSRTVHGHAFHESGAGHEAG